jgi:hypothetical protein
MARIKVQSKKTVNFLKGLKKGALHRILKVKSGENIPSKKLVIKNSDSLLTRKRKQFALNAAKWHKGE